MKDLRPAHLPRIISRICGSLEFGLVLVKSQPRGVIPIGVGDDGAAVVGGGPKSRAYDVVVES